MIFKETCIKTGTQKEKARSRKENRYSKPLETWVQEMGGNLQVEHVTSASGVTKDKKF